MANFPRSTRRNLNENDPNFSLVKEYEELLRKIEKTKTILHTSGNIEVGITPHEIVQENESL